MNVVRFVMLVAILGYCCAAMRARAEGDPLRDVVIAESQRALVPALARNLDADLPLAVRSALAIGRTKNVAGRAPLRAHLTARAAALRAMCAYGLGLLADPAAAPALRARARRDSNSAVRYAAVDALGRLATASFSAAPDTAASEGAVTDLLIVAQSDADATVRGHAAAQLDAFHVSGSQAAQIVRSLQSIVNRDPDEAVRWHAAWAIYRGYATFASHDFLVAALHDRNELVRVEAARAWGRRSDPGAVAILEAAAGDSSWRVQYEVREALKRTARQPRTEHLIAVPPGIHLPALPSAGSVATENTSTASPASMGSTQNATATTIAKGDVNVAALASPSASASASASANAGRALATASPTPTAVTDRNVRAGAPIRVTAPDAKVFELAAPVMPVTALQMNAPAAGPHPRVRIATTKGDVVLRLYREWAPSTVANFLALAERGYFDGNRWFRIVPDFVVQTGDPNDNGEGDAGYMIPAEENPLEQRTGIIAMGLNYDAKGAIRDSAGTQFYVTLSPQLHLDRDFSVFGEVESGFEVLANLIESDRMTVVRRISDG